ncbi:hypothetical protein HH214_01965 [Mucilaginibacter robiniae]|uniref:Uncharacterized protein n=1 Tax=Mucilaginibacter robiniae TaxID=2728022 RepID=A0A7L5DUD4_9SPHI|nr:hypothetical protein [Mucilaginibacter robiniae]QJD94725.1 hypothetical protein HH214_01965 [Mucilaginibacter robiniae]
MNSDDERQSKRRSTNYPICPVCGHQFKYRCKRSLLVKTLLFWTPVKRYFCTHCAVCRYVFNPKYGDYSSVILLLSCLQIVLGES